MHDGLTTIAEYSSQCFCGVSVDHLSKQNSSECNMPCTGNSTQTCGGPDRLSVYWNSAPGAVTNRGDSSLAIYVGCWKDSVDARVLPYGATVPGGSNSTTVASCVATCKLRGFEYAGVEFAGGGSPRIFSFFLEFPSPMCDARPMLTLSSQNATADPLPLAGQSHM